MLLLLFFHFLISMINQWPSYPKVQPLTDEYTKVINQYSLKTT